MKHFGQLCAGIILIALSTIMNGYVLSILYGWLITPTYGLKPITLPQAIGIVTVVNYFLKDITLYMARDEKEEKDPILKMIKKLVQYAILNLVILLFAYIVSLYI